MHHRLLKLRMVHAFTKDSTDPDRAGNPSLHRFNQSFQIIDLCTPRCQSQLKVFPSTISSTTRRCKTTGEEIRLNPPRSRPAAFCSLGSHKSRKALNPKAFGVENCEVRASHDFALFPFPTQKMATLCVPFQFLVLWQKHYEGYQCLPTCLQWFYCFLCFQSLRA